MYTKKIIIKGEDHFKEVVKALESIGQEFIYEVEWLEWITVVMYNECDCLWYREAADVNIFYKHIPEYEIVTKTSYELKEVPKIKITCKKCGKTVELKDLAIFKSQIDFGNQVITYLDDKIICKDCVAKLINDK